MLFVEDSLLKYGGGIFYNGDFIDEDEEFIFIFENFIVLMWLRFFYFDLLRFV